MAEKNEATLSAQVERWQKQAEAYKAETVAMQAELDTAMLAASEEGKVKSARIETLERELRETQASLGDALKAANELSGKRRRALGDLLRIYRDGVKASNEAVSIAAERVAEVARSVAEAVKESASLVE